MTGPGPRTSGDAISLNYTSGTTGNPKGVVYHHRGAYLNCLGDGVTWAMPHAPVYLWTLPMFHCNGWCFTWAISAYGGTHVCLRRVEAGAIFQAIAAHGVTHFCGAPIVLNLLNNASEDERIPLDHRVEVMTAAAPPPAAVIARMEEAGFHVTHVYGLTEVYGPATVCAWHDEWNALPLDEQAALKARQGMPYATLDGLMVADPEALEPVPADGKTMGEVFMRGNTVMKGYLDNPQATEEAFAGGWFRTGDLGVVHADGYIELRDRAKDIIISGGENISTIEVEGALYRHPAVLEAAVVARPDDTWGETPLRLRHAEGWRRHGRGGADRLLPGRARPLQVPEDRGVRRAAQDLHGQGPEVRAQGARRRAIERVRPCRTRDRPRPRPAASAARPRRAPVRRADRRARSQDGRLP